jgi:hypothetical protein
MATKTVVCPDCGAAAAPGRYACSECGALLASVAVTPRTWSATEDRESSDAPAQTETVAASTATIAASAASSRVDDDPEPSPLEPPVQEAARPEPVPAPEWPDPSPAPEWPDVAAARQAIPRRRRSTATAFDEDAPLGSADPGRDPVEPDALRDHAGDGDLEEVTAAEVAAAEVSWPTREAAPFFSPVEPGPLPGPEPAVAPTAPVAALPPADPAPVAPSWPPTGDNGAIARPTPRTPAGAYLPPSAVLPPLDGGGDAARAMALSGAASLPAAARASARGAWTDRASAALGSALQGIDLTVDGTRQAIVIGAGIVALGLLLPWLNGPANEGALAGYIDRWGLAGPGMWLVLLGIVALAVIAGSSGRAAAWPVGLPAIGVACFLGGVLWPYVLGGFGRSIGVWVVLAGAIVLAAGGVLDRRDRHSGSEPGVSTGEGR